MFAVHKRMKQFRTHPKRVRQALLCLCLATGALLTPFTSTALAEDQFVYTPLKTDADGVRVYDLPSVVKQCMEANNRLQAFQEEVIAAEHAQKSALGGLLPRIDGSLDRNLLDNQGDKEKDADYLTQTKWTGQVQLRQPLFNLGILSNISRASLLKEHADIALQQTRIDLLYSVQFEFFTLLKARQDIKSYENSVARLKTQLEAVNAFYKLEMQPKLTVLQTETRLAQAELQLSTAKNEARVQHVRILGLLGISENVPVQFVGELSDFWGNAGSFEENIKTAMVYRPDVQIAKNTVKLASNRTDAAKDRVYPTVAFNASYLWQDIEYDHTKMANLSRNYVSTSVSAQWNLFEGGQTYQDIRQNMRLTVSEQKKLADLQGTVQAEVRSNMLNCQEMENQIRLSRKFMSEASEAFAGAQKRYQLAIGTITDVLDAQDQLTKAETSYNQATADYLIAIARLYYSTGLERSLIQLASS